MEAKLPILAGCNATNIWGCHTLDGTTFLTAAGIALDSVVLSGLILHESDHYNKFSHSCGDFADNDLNGPYALESKYLFSIAGFGTWYVSTGQRSMAYSRASNIANYQMCNRADLRDELLSFYYRPGSYVGALNSPPPPPTYSPPPLCALCSEP